MYKGFIFLFFDFFFCVYACDEAMDSQITLEEESVCEKKLPIDFKEDSDLLYDAVLQESEVSKALLSYIKENHQVYFSDLVSKAQTMMGGLERKHALCEVYNAIRSDPFVFVDFRGKIVGVQDTHVVAPEEIVDFAIARLSFEGHKTEEMVMAIYGLGYRKYHVRTIKAKLCAMGVLDVYKGKDMRLKEFKQTVSRCYCSWSAMKKTEDEAFWNKVYRAAESCEKDVLLQLLYMKNNNIIDLVFSQELCVHKKDGSVVAQVRRKNIIAILQENAGSACFINIFDDFFCGKNTKNSLFKDIVYIVYEEHLYITYEKANKQEKKLASFTFHKSLSYDNFPQPQDSECAEVVFLSYFVSHKNAVTNEAILHTYLRGHIEFSPSVLLNIKYFCDIFSCKKRLGSTDAVAEADRRYTIWDEYFLVVGDGANLRDCRKAFEHYNFTKLPQKDDIRLLRQGLRMHKSGVWERLWQKCPEFFEEDMLLDSARSHKHEVLALLSDGFCEYDKMTKLFPSTNSLWRKLSVCFEDCWEHVTFDRGKKVFFWAKEARCLRADPDKIIQDLCKLLKDYPKESVGQIYFSMRTMGHKLAYGKLEKMINAIGALHLMQKPESIKKDGTLTITERCALILLKYKEDGEVLREAHYYSAIFPEGNRLLHDDLHVVNFALNHKMVIEQSVCFDTLCLPVPLTKRRRICEHVPAEKRQRLS